MPLPPIAAPAEAGGCFGVLIASVTAAGLSARVDASDGRVCRNLSEPYAYVGVLPGAGVTAAVPTLPGCPVCYTSGAVGAAVDGATCPSDEPCYGSCSPC